MIRIIGAGILGQQECLLEEKFVARVAAILIFLKNSTKYSRRNTIELCLRVQLGLRFWWVGCIGSYNITGMCLGSICIISCGGLFRYPHSLGNNSWDFQWYKVIKKI